VTPRQSLTIVIPTHNRAATLRKCLEALFRQRPTPSGCDILVVDDGSVDETREVAAAMRQEAVIPVSYLHQPASGPAAARNLGLRQSSGQLVLFLGDDILAEPTLVEEHLRWHDQYPDASIGVLGFVTWSPSLTVTPYMRWLELSGNQFDYGSLRRGEDADPGRFLYTSNVSLKRELMVATGEWFDERFKHALLEDIDLGRRLGARGLRLKYNPDAVAYHDHAVTLANYAHRIELSSEYLVMLERKTKAPAAPALAADGSLKPAAPKRDHAAYAWFLLRVCGEVVRNWPYWWIARVFERRRIAPVAFLRAHRHWAQRGLLRLEARRAIAKLTRAA
jgi:glycosyltransferase involved in cell wall biosynthesis